MTLLLAIILSLAAGIVIGSVLTWIGMQGKMSLMLAKAYRNIKRAEEVAAAAEIALQRIEQYRKTRTPLT